MRNFENTTQYIKNNSVPTKVKYRDYHDFLDSYNSQKKDDQESVSSTDSGIAGSIDQKLYSLSESKSNSTSSSSINGDLNEKIVKTELPKAPATSYRQFLENYNKKKFSSVKPGCLEQPKQKVKSEIFIQINEPVQNEQKNRVINEIKANFEKISTNETTPPKINKENGSVFNGTSKTSIPTPPPPPPPQLPFQNELNRNKSLKSPSNQPPPPPLPPQPAFLKTLNNSHRNGFSNAPPKQHQQQNMVNRTNSLTRTQKVNPQIHTIYRTENEPSTIDKNDPNVKKLVYNTYRGLLGAYNNKANDFISTLPRTMVRQDKGISKQVESIMQQNSQPQTERVGIAPPPPPPVCGNIPSVRLKSEIPDKRMEPPPCVQNAMMTKDKKPFTYTPGGIDLSEIRSPRMARRIERNANFPGVQEVPRNQPPQQTGPLPPSALAAMQPQLQVQVFPSGIPPPPPGGPPPPPPPPPMQPLPMQKCVTANNEVVERPDMTRIIPENPMALLRKTSGPPQRKSFIEQVENYGPVQPRSPPAAQQNRRSFIEQEPPQASLRNTVSSPPAQVNRRSFIEQDNAPRSPPFSIQNNVNNVQQRVEPVPRSVEVPFVPKQPPQEQVPLKTSTVQLGSLYIPPVNNKANDSSPRSANSVTSTSPPNSADSPKPQSPQTPTLNKAPRPWQKQKPQQPELPSWAIREPRTPPAESQNQQQNQYQQQNQQMQSPKVQNRPQMYQQQPDYNGRQVDGQQRPAGPNVVWVTQPQVLQHPGGRPNIQPDYQQQMYVQQQPQRQQQQQQQQQHQRNDQGVRIIPIQVEGTSNGTKNKCTTPSTPNGDRSFNRQQSWTNNPTQSNAFRVIQKITQTDGDDEDDQPAVEHPPKVPQQFQQPPEQVRKMKLTEGDRELMNKFKQGVDEENYLHNEVDPRYRGAAIPSKAFRLLQSMTDGSESSSPQGQQRPSGPVQQNRSPQVRTIPIRLEDDENSRPYVHPSEQTVPEPKKYTGSSIPSRSFKILQAMTAPNNCANANQVNENRENFPNEPPFSEQRNYEQNPYPVPPYYWHDYYWPYYQQHYPPQKELPKTNDGGNKSEVKETHSTLSTPLMVPPSPVPFWGFYPYSNTCGDYKKSEQDTEESTRESSVHSRSTPFNPRDTPQNFWPYPYPYPSDDSAKDPSPNPRNTPCNPRDTPQNFWPYPYPYYYPQDNQENPNDNQEYYWDPYSYYYYPHPQIYSPYPFYYPTYDTEDVAGYSSTDEMAYYTQKFGQDQQNNEKMNQIQEEKDEETQEEEEEEEEENESSDTEVDEENIAKSGSLKKIPSVPNITVYDEDDIQSDEDDDEESTAADDDETFPHQLSVIYEESERSDSRRTRESSVCTVYSDSTIVDNDDNDEDEEINTTITVKLPLKLNYTKNDNKEITMVTVGDSKIDIWEQTNVDLNSIEEKTAFVDNCDLNECDNDKECDKLEETEENCDNESLPFCNNSEELESNQNEMCVDEEIKQNDANNNGDEEEEIDFWSTIKSNESPPLHTMSTSIDLQDDEICSTSSSNSSSSKSSESNKISNTQNKCDDTSDEDSDSDDSVDSIKITANVPEEKNPSVREIIQAIEENRLSNKKSSAKSSVKSLEDYSEEEIDSGVTSDVSRHISEVDTDEFSELRRMTRYQRAATHSRLYKLLQEVCAVEDETNEENQDTSAQAEEIHVSLVIKHNKDKQMHERREQLSLPLKTNSDQESFCSSGINSPGSGEFVNEKLVNELIHSLLKRKKGHIFRSMPKEKLYAAAIRILQEEMDCSENSPSEDLNSFLSPFCNGTESSTPAQTPQEFHNNYNEYKNYYDTWKDADSTTRTQKNTSKSGARCPRVSNSKNLHRVLESPKNPPQTPSKTPNVESAIENEATDAS